MVKDGMFYDWFYLDDGRLVLRIWRDGVMIDEDIIDDARSS